MEKQPPEHRFVQDSEPVNAIIDINISDILQSSKHKEKAKQKNNVLKWSTFPVDDDTNDANTGYVLPHITSYITVALSLHSLNKITFIIPSYFPTYLPHQHTH